MFNTSQQHWSFTNASLAH